MSDRSAGEKKIFFLSNGSLNNSGKLLRLGGALFHIHAAAHVCLGSSAGERGGILSFCSAQQPGIHWLGVWTGFVLIQNIPGDVILLPIFICFHRFTSHCFCDSAHRTFQTVSPFTAVVSCCRRPPLTTNASGRPCCLLYVKNLSSSVCSPPFQDFSLFCHLMSGSFLSLPAFIFLWGLNHPYFCSPCHAPPPRLPPFLPYVCPGLITR